MPDVSITTVLYNSSTGLKECLESVRPWIQNGVAEYFIVNNATPDDSFEIAKRCLPEAVFLETGRNLGFAGGCNFALKYLNARYWLLLNPDTIVTKNCIAGLIKFMDDHLEVGIASPNLIGLDGGLGCPGRSFPTLARSFLELTRLHLLLRNSWRERYFMGSYSKSEGTQYVDWVVGAAIIVRQEAVADAGPLSEEVKIFGEDSEWCWRIGKAGWKVAVCNDLLVIHNEGQSGKTTWGDTIRLKKMWEGIYDSSRLRRGAIYTFFLKLLNTVSFAMESVHPGRSKEHRLASGAILNAHLKLWRNM